MVNQTLHQHDVMLVADIPLSRSWPSDSRYWWPTSDGVYTFKTGYWLGMLGRERTWQLAFSTIEAPMWKRVWSLQGPPKLRHFIWQACKGSLAVKAQLRHRHIVPDATCQTCGAPDETIIHALFQCPLVDEIWRLSSLVSMVNMAPFSAFADHFLWMMNNATVEEFHLFSTLTWAALLCRNKALFDTSPPSPSLMVVVFCRLVKDYVEYQKKVGSTARNASCGASGSWSKPLVGWVKVNVDAHVSMGNGVRLGVVTRDHDGDVLAATVMRVRSRWEASGAEVAAARYGVGIARRFGLA
ncbi:uncharacterized protein LOC104909080 [Beta vulgaris subsp. vulgaris]|uniref:uncharacterized protein LOC104909080 n=1 Tax=Beta vulgaris subsp. vulgaris TaxID=3555 RepID=UPI00053F3600|nr:uncharacterized protein LOC104909080 [Beta vulgaris subsp. vulgaris]